MENSVIEAYVTNLGKYNEGELVGEWVKFPVTKEEMDAVFDRIGIGEGYEEIFITDYDTNIYGLSSQLGEYENLEKLNYLAGVIAELDVSDREKYEAVLESGLSVGQNGIDGLINLAYNLDNYEIYPDVGDEDSLGRYYAEVIYGEDLTVRMGDLANYVDFERFGNDCQINEGGMFTDSGYMKETGAMWNKYYDGSLEDIPDEYRLNAGDNKEAEKMTVLVVEPMKKPYVKEIVHTLENLQKEVGGSIEAAYPFEDRVAIVCNDEHKFNGMQMNRCLRDAEGEVYDILAGNFLVVGLGEYDFASLTPEQAEKFMAYFQTPEMFVQMNGGLVVLPAEETEIEAVHEQENRTDATYSIYQLKQEEDMRDYSFASMAELQTRGLSVNPDNYEKVYEAAKTAEDTLDSIYYKFNMEHPADFRGHSLSVSDVIVFHENGIDTAHYVDSYGFTAIPDFVTAKEIMVGMDTVGLSITGHDGTWHTIEELTVLGESFYLMERENADQDAYMVVVDHLGEPVVEDVSMSDRTNVKELVMNVLGAEIEAVAASVVPDHSITHEDMVAYGYDWDGMIPLREQTAEKLYDAGFEVFVLHPNNAEAVIENKECLADYVKNSAIFGVEKVAWARFVEANSLAKVEELLEDDYGMIDGIINNGEKRETEQEKKISVMEKLTEGKEAVKKYDREKSHEHKEPSRQDREI